ncbi:MAG: glycosyltransferase family 39 protein, partial [Phycisphaerales bacterium]
MKMERKRDAINLFILIIVACVLGIYLIASTVLISKDGVFYIEQARLFSSDPADVMRGNAPGYPFLILAAHSFVGLFGDNSSLFGWIYTAQGVTLLFRLLALVPLYLIGKQLVGSRKSFYALLLLILLPHPAKMACELTREWPYMLFLATGFLFLLWGARRGRWWAFGLAGLATGLGYWIRPACIQLVIYGSMWLTLSMVWPRVGKMCRA